MESYIEITWLNAFLILMNSSTLAFYLSMKPCKCYQLLIYSAIIPAVACICFSKYEWLFMLLLEAGCFYWIYRNTWKTWLLMIAHRLLLHFSCYVLFGGSFHLGIYFVPVNCVPWLLWIILIGTWLAMFLYWKMELSQQNFVYPFELLIKQTKLQLKGYLDSGNFMMEEGLPIMFLDEQYQTYFKNENIQWMMMNTIQGETRIACYKAQARFPKMNYRPIFIHFTNQLKLPFGACALLNIHMMTQE